ncbi:hypothetical protein BZG36_04428 [Bifiguratus adelaidae]|uniref:U6 snRNA phosphodiesterase 1 n=1 Tax=Bifiguratus adelaidae TaxID=1938954 RepID=A0A261XWQ8_9FUNG|nr:hypothetical protein BZG36_04428 [Bifiguratus adelaidae]
MSLVSYSSSEEEEPVKRSNEVSDLSHDETKRQKIHKVDLPPLPSSILPPTSKGQKQTDHSALYEGRVRNVPFVEGIWPVHVYIEVHLPEDVEASMTNMIQSLQSNLKDASPIYSDFTHPSPFSKDAAERKGKTLHFGGLRARPFYAQHDILHISLSKCAYLQTHRLDRFVERVRQALGHSERFDLAFSSLTHFDNEQKTRSFLSLEVGFGYQKLLNMVKTVDNIMVDFKQPKFYKLGSMPALPGVWIAQPWNERTKWWQTKQIV